MNVGRMFGKLKKLKEKRFSGKTAMLYFLNRKMHEFDGGKEAFGKLVDVHLNRRIKEICIEIDRKGEQHSIAISGYKFAASKGESVLKWSAVTVDGPSRERYIKLFQGIEYIPISKRYVSLLEAAL